MASAKARSARCLFYLRRAKIIAVIAQKLQNIVSDSLRALAQKQLLQKGENFALMRRRAAVVGINVKPRHDRSEVFCSRRFLAKRRVYSGVLPFYCKFIYQARGTSPKSARRVARPRLLPHRKAKCAAINKIRYT